MARCIDAFVSVEPACAYLPDQIARTEIYELEGLTSREYGSLLERGWRRFGNRFFRPRCPGCSACTPLRVPVATFRPGRDQRRAARRCGDVSIAIGRPVADRERLDGYNRWQQSRQARRAWAPAQLDLDQYEASYCFPHPWAREMTYRIDGKLAAVGLVDETPSALSSVFFYFDPDFEKRSLGTFGALAEIAAATRFGIPYLYLGYWVAGCPSLAYKANFNPHEIMPRFPETGEPPIWVPGGQR
jgi:arginine-tRNA-protein transferase